MLALATRKSKGEHIVDGVASTYIYINAPMSNFVLKPPHGDGKCTPESLKKFTISG